VKHLKKFESYYAEEEEILRSIGAAIGDILFKNYGKKFYSFEFWNKHDNEYSCMIKYSYIDEEIFKITKQIWKLLRVNNTTVDPSTNYKIGYFLKIKEKNLLNILEDLKKLAPDKKILEEIIKDLALFKIKLDENKYNI
jgi:hypothetical protein